MRPWVVYYSLSGNTKRIADEITEALGCESTRLETALAYPKPYDAVIAQGEDEVRRGHMPALRPYTAMPPDCDAVILGTPVWWYTVAPAIRTFLAQNELSGKAIYPFATNGGWIGHTFRDIEALCPGAVVKESLSLRFDGSSLRTESRLIHDWIKRIKE